MLSIAAIFLSVLLAGASLARRVICSPGILGSTISITNGPLEAGFSSNGSTLVSQPISEAILEFAVATSVFPGEFTLFFIYGFFVWKLTFLAARCSSCVPEGGLVGEGCLNISDATTTPVGSPVTLGDCEAIGASINIYNERCLSACGLECVGQAPWPRKENSRRWENKHDRAEA
ncbi:hypothetical protein C8R45DRAFT_935931 [Mycena sanguinolenta]|nr:hypothetical protein C8R45DRAFT_935931 [Mycena sanguinolenta]